MKKISYKSIAIIILIFSIIMLRIFKNAPLTDYIKIIGISISINLISSVIIIYLIDFKRADDEYKELEQKRRVIYRQLINPLRDFDSFILHMYKSVVTYEEMERLDYNIENIDRIVEKIKLIDNTKNSYIMNGDLTSQTWKESILNQLQKFLQEVSSFNDNNSYILTNSLNENINNILIINSNKHIINSLLYYSNARIKTEDILDIFNFKQLLISSFKIKEEISEYCEVDQFKINKQYLLRDDISPRFRSGINKK